MKMNRQIIGKGIAPGYVTGKAYIHKDILERDYKLYSIEKHEIDSEFTRIETAFKNVLDDLIRLTIRIEQELDSEFADIFRCHKMILSDPNVLQELRNEMEKEWVNAEHIVKTVFMRYQNNLFSMEHNLLRDRADDMADLAKRLLRSLMDTEHFLVNVPSDIILILQRFFPSDTVFLKKNAVTGIVVEYCGTASHSAILAREMGIPVVSGISNIFETISNGDELLVDGISGRIVIDPDSKHRKIFLNKSNEYKTLIYKAKKFSHAPAVSLNGIHVSVLANIGSYEDVLLAIKNGAEGIGLYRLEQFYFHHNTLPTENDLVEGLNKNIKPAQNLPVTIRLLDTGADKKLPYLTYPKEINPLLGRRGIRFLLENPNLLNSQLNALLKLSKKYSLRILVPMVTLVEDMYQVRIALENCAKKLKIKKIPLLGAMIETPAAALCAADIAEYTDFFSIGTNDLTQYTLAAGREEEFISDYYREDHPAVYQLIKHVCQEVPKHEIEICGELAGNSDAITVLLQMGIKHLSVLPLRIPAVKEIIRNLEITE